ncbi:tail fiber domain-containing protein [Chitinophaga sp. NPDC101104]|uniref:tail fiber domain-containing protein n=1 Tax=Chitinophaga sp. NPDC101104 TaxID=3390561 RepID=UPI003D02F7A0
MLSRTLFTLSILLTASIAAKAQHVYSIRADSVRIYNVCDTAELILENHTQGVTGYLFNRGAGRTEFRRLQLKKLGGTRIAIAGQDTLDLSQMSGIGGIDTIYRSGDSIKYVKKGITTALFAPAAGSASYIQNQVSPTPQEAGFHITGRGLTRGMLEVRKNGADTISDGIMLRTANVGYGANFQLTAATVPGLATWVNTGSAWVKRMEIAPNGYVSYERMVEYGFSGEKMSQRFNALGFNRNVWNGAIYDTSAYAFQFTHIATGSPATDNLSLLVYDRQGGEVNHKALAINGLGNIGISERNPSERLQVANGEIYVRSNGNSNNTVHKGIKFGTDNDLGYSAIRAWRGATSNRIGMSFFISNPTGLTEAMRLTEDGRLGIGMLSPAQALDVNGNIMTRGTVFTGKITSGDSDSSLQMYGGGTNYGGEINLFGGLNGGRMTFHTGTGAGFQPERMRISANGNLGIGNNNPFFPLHVNTINTAGMAVQNTEALSAASGAYMRLYNSGTPTAAGQRLGSVLYGANTSGTTYVPGAQVDAVTESAWTGTSHPTSLVFYNTPVNAVDVAERMRLTSAGNLSTTGTVTATAFYQTSRRELKTQIGPFTKSGLDVLRSASVRTFRFKADQTQLHIGFIADEVPGEMATPGRQGVDQGNTVALLVAAVQELEKKNKTLEDKLEALEKMVRELKDKQ